MVADHCRYTLSADMWALGSLIVYMCNRTERLMPHGTLRGGYSEGLTGVIRGMLQSPYFVVRCNPGTTTFDEWSIWRSLGHIAIALDYLQGMRPQPILHSDLKPDNVLGVTVMENGLKYVNWKLADFGIAKLLTENDQVGGGC